MTMMISYLRICFMMKDNDNLPEGLNVVGTVSSSGEIGQVELDLIPAFIETHGHSADEGLDTRC